ncbi:hypothetical protein M8J77_025046 [Diaphorina citri]|nr:hypothetical protein M8J77_025046 [Diaphorina citri]
MHNRYQTEASTSKSSILQEAPITLTSISGSNSSKPWLEERVSKEEEDRVPAIHRPKVVKYSGSCSYPEMKRKTSDREEWRAINQSQD